MTTGSTGIGPDASGGSTRRDRLWALAFVLVSASLQIIQKVPFDGDTAYHVAVARLTAEHGILHRFPWTPFSYAGEHYADTELFFHLLLVPISHLSYPLAAQIAGTALGSLFLWTFYRILCRERVESPGLWTLAMLASSGAFLMRLALVRPALVSMTLMLTIAWAAIHRKWRWVGLLSFLYPLFYIAWHAVLALLLLVESARFVAQRTIAIRNLGIWMCATTVAVLVHPNFPANTQMFWIENVEVLLRKAWGNEAGFTLGQEFAPLSLEMALRYFASSLVLVATALVPAVRRRAENFPAFAFLACAMAFIPLTFMSHRFVEYAVPFCFLAGATSLPWMRKPLLLALIPVMAAWTLLLGSQRLREFPQRRDLFPSNQAQTLRAIIPEGAQVFTCGWELTGEMMLALPERKFLATLEPVSFWAANPELYRTWVDVVQHPPKDAAAIVKSRFQAGFILCDARPKHLAFIQTVDEGPGVTRSYRIGPWALFVLKDST